MLLYFVPYVICHRTLSILVLTCLANLSLLHSRCHCCQSGLQASLILTGPMSWPNFSPFLTIGLFATTLDDSPLPRSLSRHRWLGKTSSEPTSLASPPDSPPCILHHFHRRHYPSYHLPLAPVIPKICFTFSAWQTLFILQGPENKLSSSPSLCPPSSFTLSVWFPLPLQICPSTLCALCGY